MRMGRQAALQAKTERGSPPPLAAQKVAPKVATATTQTVAKPVDQVDQVDQASTKATATPPPAHSGQQTPLLQTLQAAPKVQAWAFEAFALAFSNPQDGLSDGERLAFRRVILGRGVPDGLVTRNNFEQTIAHLRESKAAQAASPPLTIDELLAIHSYTGFGSGDTNSASANVGIDVQRRLIVQGLAKLPAEKGTFLRIHMRDTTKQYVDGAVVTEPTFLSSSFGRDLKDMAAGTIVFSIEGRSGRDISSLSGFERENEVLFAPGTRFKVLGREQVQGHDGPLTCIRLVEDQGPTSPQWF